MTDLLITAGEPSRVKQRYTSGYISFETVLPKRGEGRPSKMTPETVRKLEEAFANDCTVGEACLFANISRTTYYEMLKENPAYSDRFDQLRESVPLKARNAIAKYVDQNFDTALRYMTKKRPEEFGDKMKLEHSGEIINRAGLTPEVSKVVEEMNQKIRDAVAAPHKQP